MEICLLQWKPKNNGACPQRLYHCLPEVRRQMQPMGSEIVKQVTHGEQTPFFRGSYLNQSTSHWQSYVEVGIFPYLIKIFPYPLLPCPRLSMVLLIIGCQQ